ncbi:non-ribosomal peptide synthetase [Chitinimonas sp. BJB300]|uniref:non-ribosomal peptide synthetase n=1 Tax=Chitinimonas sp. BJB300 TaxID=1559339 RepID=UPI000C0D41C6|nr:non-ribosomal peptide synthetase [Chitinimonas sp. BJB300]PHV11873.1 non-ribosomal peptide synthetase [Chitinimonas sp. BJB300]TSJ87768.1 non-ribosomal peptide synthetase [Chitinimonas sp. BJB300]
MGAAEQALALPLTEAQYGIWLGQQLDLANPSYWTAEAVELRGELNEVVLEQALREVLAACDTLHMRFGSDLETVWQTPTTLEDWVLDRIDFSAESSALDAAQAWMQAAIARPTSLAEGPLFQCKLLLLGPEHYIWFLAVHHVALDGYGYALLAQAAAARYTSLLAGQTSAPRDWSLLSVVNEDAAYEASPARQRDQAFWSAKLTDAPEPALLAMPKPVARGVQRLRGQLTPDTFGAWQQAAANLSVDWAAWVVAGIATWLYRQTGSNDLTLGLPVMNRLGSVTLNRPCMAMNIVPLRIVINPQAGFADLVREAAKAMREIRPHQRYRYEHLRRDLGRVGGNKRLFGTVINLMPFERPLDFGGLALSTLPISAGPVEDLSISIAPRADGLRLDFDANPDAYSATWLETCHASLVDTLDSVLKASTTPLVELFGQGLSQVPGSPNTLFPAVTSDTHAILYGEALPENDVSLLQAFASQAAMHPDHAALEQDGQVLSYGELLLQVQALAGKLAEQGVGADTRVALLLPRQPSTIVAILAVLWAGGGYLPLDLASPPGRIAELLVDAKPVLLITQTQYAALAGDTPVLCLDDAGESHAAPLLEAVAVPADALAYVIYTSGSTGRPKGVLLGRNALDHFLAGASIRYQMRANDRVLQFAPFHFDASVEEIFLPLTHGATLVLRTEAMLESLPRFLAACARQRISVLDLPTAFWHELAHCLDHGEEQLPDSLRLGIIGGEAALAERVARWRALAPSHVVLLNTYGPTEATVICTTAELAGPNALTWLGDAVPIGRPLPGVGIAVVDEALRPLPLGESGELCLLGGGLARSYYQCEAENAQRFVPMTALEGNPRAYRTGDQVRLAADGQIYYLGRLDDEFKLSGYRISPAEVESALLACPGVVEAAVLGQTLAGGIKQLVAFVVANAELQDVADLRSQLLQRLPAPAVPGVYNLLERLPRNANGKIDRKALAGVAQKRDPAAPMALTPMETVVADVWREVLGVDGLRPDDDFFSLGGKSLQAIQVANRLQLVLRREVAVSMLFSHPTLAALALALDAIEAIGHQPPGDGNEFAHLLTIQSGHGLALFCIHPAEGLSWCYFGLARQLPGVPLYGLQARGLSGDLPQSFEALVTDYVATLRAAQPLGPYRLLGWSAGGAIAQAMAAQLEAMGEAVSLLALMDAFPSECWQGKAAPTEREALVALLDVGGDKSVDDNGAPLSIEAILALLCQPGRPLAGFDSSRIANLSAVTLLTMQLFRTSRTQRFEGDLLLFVAKQKPAESPQPADWKPWIGGVIDSVEVDSTHSSMSQPAPLEHIGRVLAERLLPKLVD